MIHNSQNFLLGYKKGYYTQFGIAFKNNSGVLPIECYCHNKNQHSVSKLNIRILIWVFYNKINHGQGNNWYHYSDIYIMIPTIIFWTVKQLLMKIHARFEPSFCISLQMIVVTQLFFPQCCTDYILWAANFCT